MADKNRKHLYKLTNRESEVLELMAQALNNRKISIELGVGIEAIRMHAKNIYAKLGVSSRQQASLKAIELGLVQQPSPNIKLPQTNLPLAPDKFIGRSRELSDLSMIFKRGERLITILGVGGIGKTRLAIEYAHQQVSNYKDGIFFIPLESVQSTDGIILQIIECLSLTVSNKMSYDEQLFDFLVDKHILLVIDNLEHLLEGAIILSNIIEHAPDVHIIATSHTELSLHEEVVYHLQGLSIPHADDLQNGLAYDAVKFMQQHAQRSCPNWTITEDNLPVVYELCQLTEGMPLGIILAMSWLDVFPLSQIICEIKKDVYFLEADYHNIPNRHRSIRAVFNWTWNLLSSAEQAVFMKLSIFRGGCTHSALEIITGASPKIIQSLIKKDLIYRNNQGRYFIHELLRQYGEKQLEQYPELKQQNCDAHALYYAQIAEQIMTHQLITDDAEIELENLYASWYWVVDTLNTDILWQCVCTYGMIAYQLGCFAEMKILYDKAIESLVAHEADHPQLLGSLTVVNASICTYLQDQETARAYLDQEIILCHGLDWIQERREIVYAEYHRALALRKFDHHQSLKLIEQVAHTLESIDLTGDFVAITMLAYAYSQKMTIYSQIMNDPMNARDSAVKALDTARTIQHERLLALIYGHLGIIEYDTQHYEQASGYFQEAERLYSSLNPTFDTGYILTIAGSNATARLQPDQAHHYLNQALQIMGIYGPIDGTLNLLCSIVEWQSCQSNAPELVEVVVYIQLQSPHLRTTQHAQRLLDSLKLKLSAEEFQQAVQHAQTLEYDTVLLEVKEWLDN